MDITIPAGWKETIKEVKCIKSLLIKNKIHISCYDCSNKFIQSNVSPFPDHDKLLPCFILIFTEKLLSNENFLYTAMDYFSMPDSEKFKNVYIDFLSQPRYTSYFVTYENDEKYNFSNFSLLSKLYKNFISNIEILNKQ